MLSHGKDEVASEVQLNSLACRVTKNFFVFAISVYLLLWVAIFNGYPAVFYDTATYLLNSVTLSPAPFRPIMYGLFIRLVSFGLTPWLAVVAQGAITVFVLSRVFDYLSGHSASSPAKTSLFLGLVVLLAFLTSLPWFVALLMPDVFTGVLFLSLFLLLYDPELSRGEVLFLCGVLAVSAASHLSHLPTVAILIFLLLAIYPLRSLRRWRPCRSLAKTLALLILPMSLSLTVVAVANWEAGMGFRISPAGHTFLMGALLDSGLAGDYLKKNCATEQLASCKYINDLPNSQQFLWKGHPMLKGIGGWLGSREEVNKIIMGTVRQHPIRLLGTAGKQMLRQLPLSSPQDTAFQESATSPMNVDTVRLLFPGDFPKYDASQQYVGRLERLAHRAARVQKVVFWAALLISLVIATMKRSGTRSATQLFVPTLTFMLANAGVTGALSGVFNRYQSRISWLILLCCFGYFLPVLLQNTRTSLAHGGLDQQALAD